MIARITRALLILQFAVAAGIATLATQHFHIHHTAFAALLGIVGVLLARLLITANNFYMAWRYRSETPAPFHLTLRQACKLFFGEYWATMTASSWNMPFHRFANKIAPCPCSKPVLLIHGYACNSGYWRSMSAVLTRAHVTHFALDMEPVGAGIDVYVPSIHAAVERICSETGHDKIVIVAHSMGGLAARAYLRSAGSTRIARVITVGTPHHGTALARFGIGLNTEQMRWDANSEKEGLPSRWLRSLAETENEEVCRLFVSIYSHHDNIIAPQISCHLPGANNIALHGIGHVALASHPTVQALVTEEIREASLNDVDPGADANVAQPR